MIEKEYCYRIYKVKSDNRLNVLGYDLEIFIAAREVGSQGEWCFVDHFESLGQYEKARRQAANRIKWIGN